MDVYPKDRAPQEEPRPENQGEISPGYDAPGERERSIIDDLHINNDDDSADLEVTE